MVITGTNGKSTTTALTAHLLAAAGKRVALGGNIGKAVLDLDPFAPDLTYVIELSSFQIELAPGSRPMPRRCSTSPPTISTATARLQNYAAHQILDLCRHLAPGGTAVIGVDDEPSRAIADSLNGPFAVKRIAVGHTRGDRASSPSTACCMRWRSGSELARIDLAGIGSLRGAHNWQNAAAAYALARSQGLASAAIAARPQELRRPRPPHGAGGAPRQGAVRQQLQGHQCRRRGQGAGELHRHLLDHRRQAERGRVSRA